MSPNEYQKLANRTECDQDKAFQRMTVQMFRLNHACIGVAKEAGEALQLVERWIYHGGVLDCSKLTNELGDVLWFVAQACNTLDIDMLEVMTKNIDKLKERFPEKYDETKARGEGRNDCTEQHLGVYQSKLHPY